LEIATKGSENATDGGFAAMNLSAETLATLEHMGYETPSRIQTEFIPVAMTGQDCMGQARTGTGKTAAFVLPMVEQLDPAIKAVQAIVLAPTRELSEQVAAEAERLAVGSDLRLVSVVGGRPIRQQIAKLERGAQIVVGTPGRVLDLIQRRALILKQVRIAVLDEADRMLDIGFLPDIERILRQSPSERQTLLLSATFPTTVERLARRFMKEPRRIDVSENEIAVNTIEQFYITVDFDRKFETLIQVMRQERPPQALVFTRTKRGAEKIAAKFERRLKNIAMIHGDLPQRKRDRVIKDLRSGKIRMLVATDVVGRGIDISGISHIINYDIPEYCDDYVHRVGRTGRMSSDVDGRAITFVTREQGGQLTSIEIRINTLLPEYPLQDFEAARPGPERKTVDEAAPVFGTTEIDYSDDEADDFGTGVE
jgi:ATP-dependent RNA helicase DeaD